MGALTLDEVEERATRCIDSLRTREGYLRIGAERRPPSIDDVLFAADALLVLVAHVRELGKVLPARADMAVERITALEEKVSAVYAGDSVEHRVLTSEMDRLRAENEKLQQECSRLRSENEALLSLQPREANGT